MGGTVDGFDVTSCGGTSRTRSVPSVREVYRDALYIFGTVSAFGEEKICGENGRCFLVTTECRTVASLG